MIYLNDHRPAHVHVLDGRQHAIFDLNCPVGAPALQKNHGFSQVDANTFARRMQNVVGSLCTEWKTLHDGFC
ncbi:DUF4160 domain-containing protein [Caballeronia sp. SEWSISQ10-4 2]|uniref:DUF4160 domain-containing protein n=1 Tax=Caballeronia sp. SEWSISQ10-4 2 TaxID=2937438 RepID=UPI002656F49E|nr:DUF4160 domain-containing protein [Caballeronia sp. SEWSISQ10-4 2]MDN7176656.1 DUF4160 domain-containing protein [Caballeronia sp. SEWSISQ10-4 2]